MDDITYILSYNDEHIHIFKYDNIDRRINITNQEKKSNGLGIFEKYLTVMLALVGIANRTKHWFVK